MADGVKTCLEKERPLESVKEALDQAVASGTAAATIAANGNDQQQQQQQSAPASPRPGTAGKNSALLVQFRAFAKFGDTKADGKAISLSQSDKWMKQAKVIDGKKITATDTGIYFKKFKSIKLGFADYQKFIDELAKMKKVEAEEIRNKMVNCGLPGTSGTTSAVKTAAVDRLTDASKYTGSHRLRFDETGRGRGIEGRKDVQDGSGYVQGYGNKDSYDKHH